MLSEVDELIVARDQPTLSGRFVHVGSTGTRSELGWAETGRVPFRFLTWLVDANNWLDLAM